MAKYARVKAAPREVASDDWIHLYLNFSWDLPRTDIHDCVSVDMLYGLYKGIFENLITMLRKKVGAIVKARKTKASGNDHRTYTQSAGMVRWDDQFDGIPDFPGLKHFRGCSKITQWTGSEQRDLS
jgi:hypothetical protein